MCQFYVSRASAPIVKDESVGPVVPRCVQCWRWSHVQLHRDAADDGAVAAPPADGIVAEGAGGVDAQREAGGATLATRPVAGPGIPFRTLWNEWRPGRMGRREMAGKRS